MVKCPKQVQTMCEGMFCSSPKDASPSYLNLCHVVGSITFWLTHTTYEPHLSPYWTFSQLQVSRVIMCSGMLGQFALLFTLDKCCLLFLSIFVTLSSCFLATKLGRLLMRCFTNKFQQVANNIKRKDAHIFFYFHHVNT